MIWIGSSVGRSMLGDGCLCLGMICKVFPCEDIYLDGFYRNQDFISTFRNLRRGKDKLVQTKQKGRYRIRK
jgi:hypothetical protein